MPQDTKIIIELLRSSDPSLASLSDDDINNELVKQDPETIERLMSRALQARQTGGQFGLTRSPSGEAIPQALREFPGRAESGVAQAASGFLSGGGLGGAALGGAAGFMFPSQSTEEAVASGAGEGAGAQAGRNILGAVANRIPSLRNAQRIKQMMSRSGEAVGAASGAALGATTGQALDPDIQVDFKGNVALFGLVGGARTLSNILSRNPNEVAKAAQRISADAASKNIDVPLGIGEFEGSKMFRNVSLPRVAKLQSGIMQLIDEVRPSRMRLNHAKEMFDGFQASVAKAGDDLEQALILSGADTAQARAFVSKFGKADSQDILEFFSTTMNDVLSPSQETLSAVGGALKMLRSQGKHATARTLRDEWINKQLFGRAITQGKKIPENVKGLGPDKLGIVDGGSLGESLRRVGKAEIAANLGRTPAEGRHIADSIEAYATILEDVNPAAQLKKGEFSRRIGQETLLPGGTLRTGAIAYMFDRHIWVLTGALAGSAAVFGAGSTLQATGATVAVITGLDMMRAMINNPNITPVLKAAVRGQSGSSTTALIRALQQSESPESNIADLTGINFGTQDSLPPASGF